MRRAAIVALWALLLPPQPALALNPTLDVSQYAHTAWRSGEGVVSALIRSMAQTSDGYLWLATDSGLLRFDGVKSVPWQPPAGQALPGTELSGLLAARDGSLWIATTKGLAQWKGGTLTRFPQLAGQLVYPLLEDRDGAIWAGTIALHDGKVCVIQRGVARCEGGGGRIGNGVFGLHEDRTGAMWVAVWDGLWRWRPGPPRFHAIPDAHDGIQSFDDQDDGLLFGTPGGLRRLADGKATDYPLPGVKGRLAALAMLRDRDGGLWIGTNGQGLVHVYNGRADVFTATRGLSDDTVTALYEDREGNIWASTTGGLDRFRDVAIATSGANQGLASTTVTSVLSAADGSIWFAANRVLNQRQGPETRIVRTGTRGPAESPHSLFEDRRGRLWISTLDGLGYFADGRLTVQAGVPGGSVVHAIGEDTAGNIWVAQQDNGLFRVAPDGTVSVTPWRSLGFDDFATAFAADPGGGMWIGFYKGGVVHLASGVVRATYTAADGLGLGRVSTLRFDHRGALWAATAGGLSRLHNGRLATLTSRNGLPCDVVHWEIEDDGQAAWLLMPCGLVRVPLSDVEAWAAAVDDGRGASQSIRTRVFDTTDGVRPQAFPAGYSPLVSKSADGKIWFASPDGLSVVDPRHLPFNNLPPPVLIEGIVADRTAYSTAAPDGIRLPALTRDVQVDYTALSLAVPEKVRFRYRLDGSDHDWRDVGNRRQAFYNNLPPGTYRFRVIASNNDGVWNETGATVAFAVAPAYYQTNWFIALSAGLVLGLVWGAHRLRLHIVETHEREIIALNERLMQAQEQERIRIAGELHDGVMQQMLAVTMMLGTAKRRIADNPEAAATIDKAQEKLVQAGTEIRQLSHDLHPPALQEAGLPQAVRTYCEQFSAACDIPVSCEADDRVHELSRGAALALFRIMQEALGNAAKHAAPRSIAVRLTRSGDTVSLVVADDGAGFDGSRLGRSGGLGLIMMRERASQLNGRFEFESAPGRGTTIRVTIPFR